MVLLRLMGGLGNQMSQVAFAYIVSRINNKKLIIETTSYRHYKRRPCSIQLMKLNDSIKIYNNMNTLYYYKCRVNQIFFHITNKLFYPKKARGKKWFYWYIARGHIYSFDSDYYELPVLLREKNDIYGYYLIEKYFEPYYDEICDLFEIKPENIGIRTKELEKMIEQYECPIAISMRLQDDYLMDETLNVCTRKYFDRAIEVFIEKFPNAQFIIFADDIERAKKYNLGIEAIYIEGISAVESMHLMHLCKHFIISNSSFSWWGAYLALNKDKIVIAPNIWVKNNKDYSAKYYNNMVKIEV